MSIRLSEKHGVNPTIPVCFWCGKDRNEVALLGKLKGDKEAQMHMIIDYEPCDECKSHMEKGITLIGVTDEPPDERPPIVEIDEENGLYPTGGWMVLKEEGFRRIFDSGDVDADDIEKTIKRRKCLINQKLLEELDDLYKNIQEEDNDMQSSGV